MSPRDVLLSIGAAFLVVGMFLGFRAHSVDSGFSTIDCGSVFQPYKKAGDIEDSIGGSDLGGECGSSISDAKPLTYGALGFSALAFIAALVAPTQRSRRPAAQ